MFTKVLIVCAVAVAAFAAELPPGIHPALCPNYPYCDMELLAHHSSAGIPILDRELPYARMMPGAGIWPYVASPSVYEYPFARMMPAPVKVVPEKTPVAVEYPADVDPASCPNYPYCA